MRLITPPHSSPLAGHFTSSTSASASNCRLVVKRALFAFLRHYTVTPRADLQQVILTCATKHGLQVDVRHLHRGYTDYAVLIRKLDRA